MVRVHYGEGVAIHTGPESCADGRKAVGEALTGEHAGQVLSGVSKFQSGADAVTVSRRQYGTVRHRERRADPAPSETLERMYVFCAGTGRSPSLPWGSDFRDASERLRS